MRSRSRNLDWHGAVYVVAVIGEDVTWSTLETLRELINVKLIKDVNSCLPLPLLQATAFFYGEQTMGKESINGREMDG